MSLTLEEIKEAASTPEGKIAIKIQLVQEMEDSLTKEKIPVSEYLRGALGSQADSIIENALKS